MIPEFVLLLLLPALQLGARPLLVISVDGLDYRYLRNADQLGLRIPHMRRMVADAARRGAAFCVE